MTAVNASGWNWDRAEADCCPDGYEGAFIRCQSCGATDKWGPERVTYSEVAIHEVGRPLEMGFRAYGHGAYGYAPTKAAALLDLQAKVAGGDIPLAIGAGPNCRCVTIGIADQNVGRGDPVTMRINSLVSESVIGRMSSLLDARSYEPPLVTCGTCGDEPATVEVTSWDAFSLPKAMCDGCHTKELLGPGVAAADEVER